VSYRFKLDGFVYKQLQELLRRVKRRILGIRHLNHSPLDLLRVEGIPPSKRNSGVALGWPKIYPTRRS